MDLVPRDHDEELNNQAGSKTLPALIHCLQKTEFAYNLSNMPTMYKYIICFLVLNYVFALSFANAAERTQRSNVSLSTAQGNYHTLMEVAFIYEIQDVIPGIYKKKEITARNEYAGSPIERSFARKIFYGETSLRMNSLSWNLIADRFMAYHINFHGLLSVAFMAMLLSILFPHNKPNNSVRPNQ